ncbi:hypothetical protein NQ318_007529 [Aromia moschata]|uniref:DUF5641 domain-containing protein n=1 Tax=Aromia moschata TaxID=1265417 RepID=A0AAV8YEJ5_9CUCU|nr:hypothetical protein NQ318_007529 [Aromia moschata]
MAVNPTMYAAFCSRWQKECLRAPAVSKGTLKEGILCIIKEDGSPPLKWKLGRVIKLHSGRDGISRVATLRTQGGEVKRSYSRICPLPIKEPSGIGCS